MLLAFGIFLFLLLVVAHEYGHFLVAKRNGVEVEEFGIGFPPKLFGKTIGKGIFRSYYTINLLPLGGFVRLKGENSSDTRKGSFGATTLKQKAKIALAGVAANIVVAMILFTIVGWVRMPIILEDQYRIDSDTTVLRDDLVVTFVGEGTPAEKAGLEPDSIIRAINGDELSTNEQLMDATKQYAGTEITIAYQDDTSSEQQTTTAQLNDSNKDGEGYLGVAAQRINEEQYGWSAPIVGAVFTVQVFAETGSQLFGALGQLFAGNTEAASANVGGPVLIVYLLSEIDSVSMIVFIMGTISVALAFFNMLPFPALDGGRLFVTAMFEMFNIPLTEKAENMIHGSGFVALLALAAVITFVDFTRIL